LFVLSYTPLISKSQEKRFGVNKKVLDRRMPFMYNASKIREVIMKSISREDYGYYEAPPDYEEMAEERERREAHDEDEADEKRLREGEK